MLSGTTLAIFALVASLGLVTTSTIVELSYHVVVFSSWYSCRFSQMLIDCQKRLSSFQLPLLYLEQCQMLLTLDVLLLCLGSFVSFIVVLVVILLSFLYYYGWKQFPFDVKNACEPFAHPAASAC